MLVENYHGWSRTWWSNLGKRRKSTDSGRVLKCCLDVQGCFRQLTFWMGPLCVITHLHLCLCTYTWMDRLNQNCSFVFIPVCDSTFFSSWLGSLDVSHTWFIAYFVCHCWWTLLPAHGCKAGCTVWVRVLHVLVSPSAPSSPSVNEQIEIAVPDRWI